VRIVRAISRNEAVRGVLCWLGAQYIRLVYRTGRWRVVGGDVPRALWEAERPFILAFWHGRLLMMPYCWNRGVPIHMLISRHPDGRIIARTVGHFGIDTVAGSSTKGGSAALRAILRLIESGACVGFTPDGPRGPRMRASMGIIHAARLSGAPIMPATFGSARRWVLGSWDRFVVALPFARGVFLWGEPLAVPREADETAQEAARQTLEARLNELTDEADRLTGTAPVQPAPAANRFDVSGAAPAEAAPPAGAGGR